jgi:hypothetical protein
MTMLFLECTYKGSINQELENAFQRVVGEFGGVFSGCDYFIPMGLRDLEAEFVVGLTKSQRASLRGKLRRLGIKGIDFREYDPDEAARAAGARPK